MQPTAAEVARQKKVADQANWLPTPAPIKNLYPNAPDTMPPQVLDSYTRLLQSGDKDAADRQLRRDIADQSNETRRDIAAQNAQARAEAAATSGGRADTVALDRQVKQFGAPYQRMYDGVNSQLDKILDAEKMISGGAVDQALGVPKVLTALVSGQGSGVRITQPELQAIYKSRGITGDVEGWWNSITGQGKLTKDQQKQLGLILGDVRQRIQSKQQIVQDTLDKINGASGRQEIVAADKDARDRLRALESPQQQTQLPPQAAAQLKEGIHTTFGNGQTWTLKNGQPNQVK